MQNFNVTLISVAGVPLSLLRRIPLVNSTERETKNSIIIITTETPLTQAENHDIMISIGHHRHLTISSRENHGGRIGKVDKQQIS
jgi:hypothetical protein